MTEAPPVSTPRNDRVWERACPVDELEPSWGEALLLRMKQIALVLVSPREIYAVSHRDPATGAFVMARGIVGSKGDRPTIASPLLKQVYDLGTGSASPTLRCSCRPSAPAWSADSSRWKCPHDPPGGAAARAQGDGIARRDLARHLIAARSCCCRLAGRRARCGPPGSCGERGFRRRAAARCAGRARRARAAFRPSSCRCCSPPGTTCTSISQSSRRDALVLPQALGPDDRLARLLHERLLEAGLRSHRPHRARLRRLHRPAAVADCHEMGARLARLIAQPVRVGFISAADPRLADAVESEREGSIRCSRGRQQLPARTRILR